MAANPPSSSQPAGDDRNLVEVNENTAVSFEEKLQLFWRNNRAAVLALVGLVVLVILGKGLWEHLARKKDLAVQDAYAAATTTEQLKTFAAAHPDHPLAGVAHMRMADEAYAAGKSTDAIAAYDKALGVLEDGPLAARAKLGRALAKAQAGNTAEATTELKQLANNADELKAIRTEAGYHLASLAAAAGNATEVQTYAEQLMQIDPMSPWAQRAMSLRASMPAAPATTDEKKDDPQPKIELKLPGN